MGGGTPPGSARVKSESIELSDSKTVLSNIESLYSALYEKRNDKTGSDYQNYLKILKNLLSKFSVSFSFLIF